jgi:hypothetical protein
MKIFLAARVICVRALPNYHPIATATPNGIVLEGKH